jgi:hypothetical protein
MNTLNATSILDPFACALLPVALQMNNANIKDAVTNSYEGALEVLRQRKNKRIARPRENLASGEER